MKFKTGISSKLGYVDRLRSFLTLDNIVLYSFAFLKRLEAFLIDSAEMYKDIVAFSVGNESEALLVVEPFNSSFAHCWHLQITKNNCNVHKKRAYYAFLCNRFTISQLILKVKYYFVWINR